MRSIILDPGHGGRDPGAVNTTLGFKESDIAFSIALGAEQALLNRGWNVHFTHRGQTMPISRRVARANLLAPQFLLSIHLNAGPPTAKGFEVFHWRNATTGKLLAEHVYSFILPRFPFVPRGVKPDNLAAVGTLGILKNTQMPAILVECGFITHLDEARYVRLHAEQIGEALALGFDTFVEDKSP